MWNFSLWDNRLETQTPKARGPPRKQTPDAGGALTATKVGKQPATACRDHHSSQDLELPDSFSLAAHF